MTTPNIGLTPPRKTPPCSTHWIFLVYLIFSSSQPPSLSSGLQSNVSPLAKTSALTAWLGFSASTLSPLIPPPHSRATFLKGTSVHVIPRLKTLLKAQHGRITSVCSVESSLRWWVSPMTSPAPSLPVAPNPTDSHATMCAMCFCPSCCSCWQHPSSSSTSPGPWQGSWTSLHHPCLAPSSPQHSAEAPSPHWTELLGAVRSFYLTLLCPLSAGNTQFIIH